MVRAFGTAIGCKQLNAIQIDFFPQTLNFHSQSMLVCLFTETGIMLLRICRFLLLLGYLQYLLSLKPSHLARACLNSSIELAAARKKSWVGDVLSATPGFSREEEWRMWPGMFCRRSFVRTKRGGSLKSDTATHILNPTHTFKIRHTSEEATHQSIFQVIRHCVTRSYRSSDTPDYKQTTAQGM